MSFDGLPITYRPSRIRVAAGLSAIALVGGAGWTVLDRLQRLEVEPVAIRIIDERRLGLRVSCADDVTVTVTETADAVRIEDVDGTPIDGDCAAGILVRLSSPLGDRRVFVEGEEWLRRKPHNFVPPDD